MNASRYALLLSALAFAALKHRDQRRKDKEASPYINHPIALAEILARFGVDEETTLVAAVLHDTIEDTETTPEELEKHFGREVRTIVQEVTDDKTLPKEKRKELQVEHARSMSGKAKLVKIADKICNVRDVTNSPPTGWDLARRMEYLEWTSKVVEGCRGIHSKLEKHYDEILMKGRQTILENSQAL